MYKKLYFSKNTYACLLLSKTIFLLLPLFSFGQTDSTISLSFDFNNQKIKEKDDKVIPKPVGVSLTYDRFGNEAHALYIMGHASSYLNLGTSPLFKSPVMSISMWVKLDRKIYTGSGFGYNPLLVLKNGPGNDFINAFDIAYDWSPKSLAVNSTKDSTEEATIIASDTLKFNSWNHIVFICNNKFLVFYLNGVLQGKAAKNFETKFLESDSLMLGHSASNKNRRYAQGVFDDIRFFHRSLTEQEVLDLYHERNPNQFKNILNEVLKYGLIVFVFGIIIIILIIRNRINLKKQKEELQLATKISELELKAVKAQMNPHFISNCMAAIQNLIYKSDIQKAGLYVAKFSLFLRQVLNYSDEDYITLDQEVEMIKLFVELEQLRFEKGFKFELIFDASAGERQKLIPALIMQPFIENAIWHGLLPLNNIREPKLTVRIYTQNDMPVIEVEDNGIGRDLAKEIKKRNKGTQMIKDKMNILNRLSKKSNYKIEIVDLADTRGNKTGTKVVIYLDNIKE